MHHIRLIAGIAPVFTLIIYGVQLMHSTEPQNAASWVMWTVLNSIVAGSSLRAGNKDVWLSLGFAIGNAFVAIVLISNGSWGWDATANNCALGAAAAMLLWKFAGPISTLIAAVLAIWIASIPLAQFTALNPDPSLWWLWVTPLVCGTVSFFAVEKWALEHWLFPASTIIFTTMMTVLTMGWWK